MEAFGDTLSSLDWSSVTELYREEEIYIAYGLFINMHKAAHDKIFPLITGKNKVQFQTALGCSNPAEGKNLWRSISTNT